MANFIQTLQAEKAEALSRIDAALTELRDFDALLLSPKHQGIAQNGERNDWISTGDVLRRLGMIRRALTE